MTHGLFHNSYTVLSHFYYISLELINHVGLRKRSVQNLFHYFRVPHLSVVARFLHCEPYFTQFDPT